MRVLITIPHFFNPNGSGKHGSLQPNPQPRIDALTACLRSLHETFGTAQSYFDHDVASSRLVPKPANATTQVQLDVLICTTGDFHVLDRLPISSDFYHRRSVTINDPRHLGMACHLNLKRQLGRYDYYGYLEDDLILRDPYFFHKLDWFNRFVGDDAVLQPNRYEVAADGSMEKAYIDPDFESIIEAYKDCRHNFQDNTQIRGTFLGQEIAIARARDPHSGCFFVNDRQLRTWVEQPHFMQSSLLFLSPLETWATLGIMQTFRVFKPSFENANFLEIQHWGDSLIHVWKNDNRFAYMDKKDARKYQVQNS